MFKRTITPTRTPDRFAYLWLALAAALLVFTGVRWAIPLAAWLAPLFLLRFVRTQHPHPGLLLAWLVRAAVFALILQGAILYSGIGYYALVLLFSLVSILPYLADRLITPRLGGFVATLVFPMAFTTVEYLSSFGPTGTFTSIANTQYGDLPLLQVMSVTGIWGITFLLTWFAAVGNWAWERGFAWPNVRGGGLMLVPSDDIQAADPSHAQDATFRAIENGFSEVREASKGLSITVDYEGRVLSASDYFTTDDQVMVAYVPMHGVRTIYATIGDLFAWLCLIGLLALTGLAIIQRSLRRSAAAAAPLPEPQPTR